LFERLVQNEVEFDTLTKQRRMIPEIRRLLYPIYGKTLKDHASVKDPSNRPPIPGMGGNDTFFWCHEHLESRDANMSVYNQKEADMVVGFFDYLVLNGLEPPKITILVFYNGQRKAILRTIRTHTNLNAYFHEVKVVTVDSYQGELSRLFETQRRVTDHAQVRRMMWSCSRWPAATRITLSGFWRRRTGRA
jgi:helicase required for RNAi-mediated heterochromatin assembly 1